MNKFQSPSLRGSGRFTQHEQRGHGEAAGFNPLHCGAVVASCPRATRQHHDDAFQSPSLRGSGRFNGCSFVYRSATTRFNPLHCGAVVASWSDSSRFVH